jgi:hypothetical protein
MRCKLQSRKPQTVAIKDGGYRDQRLRCLYTSISFKPQDRPASYGLAGSGSFTGREGSR